MVPLAEGSVLGLVQLALDNEVNGTWAEVARQSHRPYLRPVLTPPQELQGQVLGAWIPAYEQVAVTVDMSLTGLASGKISVYPFPLWSFGTSKGDEACSGPGTLYGVKIPTSASECRYREVG